MPWPTCAEGTASSGEGAKHEVQSDQARPPHFCKLLDWNAADSRAEAKLKQGAVSTEQS